MLQFLALPGTLNVNHVALQSDWAVNLALSIMTVFLFIVLFFVFKMITIKHNQCK